MREWASAQAASGYLEYDPETETFTLPPEQAMALADEDSPVYVLGGYHVVSSAWKDRDKLAERYRSGKGFGWHDWHAPFHRFHGHTALDGRTPDEREHRCAAYLRKCWRKADSRCLVGQGTEFECEQL